MVTPGDIYTFKIYNQNQADNMCGWSASAAWHYGHSFMIGYPDIPDPDVIEAIFEFADTDNDSCVSFNEMVELFEYMLSYGPEDYP